MEQGSSQLIHATMSIMSNQSSIEPDPIKKHKSDFYLQVLLPILFLVILCLGILVFFFISFQNGSTVTSTWSQISLIWLILPMLLVGILFFVLLFFLIRAIAKLHRWLPPRFQKVELFVNKIRLSTEKITKKSTDPVIGFKSALTGFSTLLHIFEKSHHGPTEEK
jgi:heme/copper-type cytochrome/quinol oxidase subunit 2